MWDSVNSVESDRRAPRRSPKSSEQPIRPGGRNGDDLGDLERAQFLEKRPDELQSIIEAVRRLPDQSQIAIGLEDRLESQFSANAENISHMDTGIEMNHRGFLYPDKPDAPYSNELELKYGQANVFGKSEINRIVLNNEALRLRTLASTMYKRVAGIEYEIKKLDEEQSNAEKSVCKEKNVPPVRKTYMNKDI